MVVDTNILFSALLRTRSRFIDTLFGSEHEFYAAEFAVVELFRHKERIVSVSRLTGTEVADGFENLLRRLHLVKGERVSDDSLRTAIELCAGVDPTDAPHVALTIELDADLWTGDRRLRRGLEARGFTRFFDPDAQPLAPPAPLPDAGA